jgi:hypothetical protein
MAWQYVEPLGVKDIPTLLARFKTMFARLSQLAKCYEQVGTLVYGTTVQVPGDLSRQLLITVTNSTNFTIANPTRPREGVELVFDIHNDTAGAIGTISWGSEYERAGAMTNPGAGTHRLIAFYRTKDGTWRELYRSSANVS